MRKSTNRVAACVAVLVAAAGLAACTSSSGTPSGGKNPSGATPTTAATTRGGSGGSLASSKLIGVTTLDQAKLCGVMNTSEAAQIMGSSTSAGQFTNTLGLGIICEWKASGGTELYVGLSTILDWAGTQALDKLLTTSPDSIDGHPALVAGPQNSLSYTSIAVALGGDHDPVVEFRAPSTAQAKSLATLVTPRLLALA